MTLDRNLLFNVLLALFMLITVPTLAALNERRLDVYLSIYTLEYFILLAILKPRRKYKDFIAAALFLVFIIIVALRILEILLS